MEKGPRLASFLVRSRNFKKKRKRKKIKEKQGKLPGKNKRTGRITRGKRGVYNRAKDDFVEHRERKRDDGWRVGRRDTRSCGTIQRKE